MLEGMKNMGIQQATSTEANALRPDGDAPPNKIAAVGQSISAAPLVRQTPAEIAQLMEQMITVSEAAHIARVSGKTIREWAVKIEGLGVKRVGRWVIREPNLIFLLRVGVERYRERLAALRSKREQTNRTHETH